MTGCKAEVRGVGWGGGGMGCGGGGCGVGGVKYLVLMTGTTIPPPLRVGEKTSYHGNLKCQGPT